MSDHHVQHGTATGRRLRAARAAAATSFALTGLVSATWAARIPSRKAELGLSDGQLAVALVGLNAGAVLGLQLGAVLVTRIGSRRALAVAMPAFAVLLVPVAYADGLAALTAALLGWAMANSVIDVAINDQGVAVQRAYGRSLLSGLHAMHSLGAVAGSGVAALTAGAGVGVRGHFAAIAFATIGIAAVSAHALLPGGSAPSRNATPRSPWTARLLVLGGLAFVFTFAEASGLDWSAVLLHDARHASAATAAAAVAVFQGSLAIGRLGGDRGVDALGAVRVFRGGALLAGGGLGAGLLVGNAAGALAGLALFGAGLANLLPISISTAGRTAGVSVPVAVARVSTCGYLGSFSGPVLIGTLAPTTGLAGALLLPAGAVAATALAARTMRGPQT
jgi:hypothetical protein